MSPKTFKVIFFLFSFSNFSRTIIVFHSYIAWAMQHKLSITLEWVRGNQWGISSYYFETENYFSEHGSALNFYPPCSAVNSIPPQWLRLRLWALDSEVVGFKMAHTVYGTLGIKKDRTLNLRWSVLKSLFDPDRTISRFFYRLVTWPSKPLAEKSWVSSVDPWPWNSKHRGTM